MRHDPFGFGKRERWRSARRGDPFEFFFAGPRSAGLGMRIGKRKRRGDIRYAILEALAERPSHGYDVIRALEQRERGSYRPSPGSVYPTLALLEDGGFVTSEQTGGKRIYTITPLGRTELSERPHDERDDHEETPSEPSGSAARAARGIRAIMEATSQAVASGDARRTEKILEIISKTRREIYQVLGEDDEQPA